MHVPEAQTPAGLAALVAPSARSGQTDACIVFFVSDSTGLTAEAVGQSLLAQFPGVTFQRRTQPFVTSAQRARDVVATVSASLAAGSRCLVFSTCIDRTVREILAEIDCPVLDLLGPSLSVLERELGRDASHGVGLAHNQGDKVQYNARMGAIEYAIEHDDGASVRHLQRAQVILLAPSRCGKTPLSMFLALQHHLFAANFPLNDEDFGGGSLPRSLQGLHGVCFGLTIAPKRLSLIREERMSDSRYASLQQCAYEVRMAEALYRKYGIPYVDSGDKSVEELAALVMQHVRQRGATPVTH